MEGAGSLLYGMRAVHVQTSGLLSQGGTGASNKSSGLGLTGRLGAGGIEDAAYVWVLGRVF